MPSFPLASQWFLLQPSFSHQLYHRSLRFWSLISRVVDLIPSSPPLPLASVDIAKGWSSEDSTNPSDKTMLPPQSSWKRLLAVASVWVPFRLVRLSRFSSLHQLCWTMLARLALIWERSCRDASRRIWASLCLPRGRHPLCPAAHVHSHQLSWVSLGFLHPLWTRQSNCWEHYQHFEHCW